MRGTVNEQPLRLSLVPLTPPDATRPRTSAAIYVKALYPQGSHSPPMYGGWCQPCG